MDFQTELVSLEILTRSMKTSVNLSKYLKSPKCFFLLKSHASVYYCYILQLDFKEYLR